MYLRSWSDFNRSLWRISHWQLHRSRCNKSDTGFKYHGLLHGRRMHLRSMCHQRNPLWYRWRHQWHRSLYKLQMHWPWPRWPFNLPNFWTLSQLYRWLRGTDSHVFESSRRSNHFTNTRNRFEQTGFDCPWNKCFLGNPAKMVNVVMNMLVSASHTFSCLQKVFVLLIRFVLKDKFLFLPILLTALKIVALHMNVYVKPLSNVKSVLKVRDPRTCQNNLSRKMAGP